MSYDCIIATKNRLDALRMSIPLILKQHVPPERLIVVDASDDYNPVKSEVQTLSGRLGFKNAIVVQSDASNLARQRNIGLRFVEAPVVMFPDDDSMWYQGFAASILKIYEADVRRQVGGITGVAVDSPPPELAKRAYAKSRFATLKGAVQPYRNSVERRLFPHPFNLIAETTWTNPVDVVDGVNARRVPHITGFRMTFRTDAIRQVGFDETLGYGAGYAYHEDFDVSLRLERMGYALVSSEHAKVCHYAFPGARSKGFAYGFCAIANCVYVCKKTISRDAEIYRSLERYLKYKLSLYAGRAHSKYGRQVFRGALKAWQNRFALLKEDEARLPLAYMALCDQYIRG
jgi:glycosyltransferase involved in cell wall biosynthesis